MFTPSKAMPRGVRPTMNIPRFSPLLARSLVTAPNSAGLAIFCSQGGTFCCEPKIGVVTQTLAPSKAIALFGIGIGPGGSDGPTGNVPRAAPSLARSLRTTVFGGCWVNSQILAPSKAMPAVGPPTGNCWGEDPGGGNAVDILATKPWLDNQRFAAFPPPGSSPQQFPVGGPT